MKRKMITLFLTTVAFVVLTPSTFARPAYANDYYYYDESGNEVGHWFQGCSGLPYGEGERTDKYIDIVDACPWTLDIPLFCEDIGFVSTNCGRDYCVTEGYYFSVVYMHSFYDPCLT